MSDRLSVASVPWMNRAKRHAKSSVFALMRAAFLIGISFMILYPLLTKLSLSFMEQQDLYDRTVQSIPKHFTWSNYPEAFYYMNYGKAFVNSVMICGVSGALQALSCVMTGYGFARFDFRGRQVAFAMVLVMMVVPPQLIMTPLYLNFQNFDPLGLISLINGGKGLRLVESLWPFLLLSITSTGPRCGLYIFFARQFFRGFPKVIDEAATIDGASHFCVFVRIMLPAAFSIMVTIFLLSFVWLWNDTMYAFLFYSKIPTVAKSLMNLQGDLFASVHTYMSSTASDIGYFSILKATGVLLAIAPLMVLYACVQKVFIQSIENTGIVG
ncbi:MAG: carbohydrate ABC transporter permease [Aristaeellaceae bacterium]